MGDEGPLARLLTAAAHAALADVLRAGPPKGPLSAQAAAAGVRVILSVVPEAPVGPDAYPLNECERDLLAVLSGTLTRLTTPRVLAELERRNLIHGESTAKKGLARLVALGLVRASHTRPRGYWLPGQAHESPQGG